MNPAIIERGISEYIRLTLGSDESEREFCKRKSNTRKKDGLQISHNFLDERKTIKLIMAIERERMNSLLLIYRK